MIQRVTRLSSLWIMLSQLVTLSAIPVTGCTGSSADGNTVSHSCYKAPPYAPTVWCGVAGLGAVHWQDVSFWFWFLLVAYTCFWRNGH